MNVAGTVRYLAALVLLPGTLAAQEPPAETTSETQQPAKAAPSPSDPPAARLWSAGGEVSFFLSSRIDYVGRFDQRLSLPVRTAEWRISLSTLVPVLSATGSDERVVGDVDYRLEAALVRRSGRLAWAPFVAARGSEEVDREGWMNVVLGGLRIGRSDPRGALDWQVEAALPIAESGIRADAALAGSGEWRVVQRPGWALGLLAAWDGIWVDERERAQADVSAGPFLRLHSSADMSLSVHALYHRGRHPLGLRDDGYLVGIRFSGEGVSDPAQEKATIQGALSAGGGNERVRVRQALELGSAAFPGIGRPLRLRILADNVLLDTELRDLYYVLEGGVETADGSLRPGMHFHHRSGHLLGQPNDRRLSLNLVEVGVRTPGALADLPRRAPGSSGRQVSLDLRAGRVLSSDLGEGRRWTLRAGAVWSPPLAKHGPVPFIGARAQLGEGRAWAGVAGLQAAGGAIVTLTAERDSQRFDSRDTSWTLCVGHRF